MDTGGNDRLVMPDAVTLGEGSAERRSLRKFSGKLLMRISFHFFIFLMRLFSSARENNLPFYRHYQSAKEISVVAQNKHVTHHLKKNEISLFYAEIL